jgi:hypothetical protein
LAYRILGWFNRRAAEHRARWLKAGLYELNPGRRLRGGKYIRIGSIVYVVCAALIFEAVATSMDRAPELAIFVAGWVASAFGAVLPAILAYMGVQLYGEWTEPFGDASLTIREKQFGALPREVVPAGQYGSSPIVDAIKAGLTNPVGLTIPRRHPVPEEATN